MLALTLILVVVLAWTSLWIRMPNWLAAIVSALIVAFGVTFVAVGIFVDWLDKGFKGHPDMGRWVLLAGIALLLSRVRQALLALLMMP